jgi:hypothetical protein
VSLLAGALNGTSIATYAGRVWIGSGRVVSYTDVDSYNSFGGAGGSFTITDSYLHSSITALVNANNYLYIFGADSIDALSNVTVTGGITAFTRLNITTSIGTVTPTSIFAYYRGLFFYNPAGFYLLSGATPEKLSQPISGVVQNVVQTSPIYGTQVMIEGELCAGMMFSFLDSFSNYTTTPTVRSLFAFFFRGRWWAYSAGSLAPGACVSIPLAAVQTLYFFSNNVLYQAFSPSSLSEFIVRSKLWDASAPLREKQSLNAAIGINTAGSGQLNLSFAVDTENGEEAPIQVSYETLTWINQSGAALSWVNASGVALTWTDQPGYYLWESAVESGGSQYVGCTLTGNSGTVGQLRIVGMRGKQDRSMLE